MRETAVLSGSPGWFWVMLCIFKHNKEACTSISSGLSGTNQWDSDRASAAMRNRKWRTGVRGARGALQRRGETSRTKPCSSRVRPSEDGRNKKPCLKWLAMPRSQHFEDRLKALWVENTILNKSTFPFCPHTVWSHTHQRLSKIYEYPIRTRRYCRDKEISSSFIMQKIYILHKSANFIDAEVIMCVNYDRICKV